MNERILELSKKAKLILESYDNDSVELEELASGTPKCKEIEGNE